MRCARHVASERRTLQGSGVPVFAWLTGRATRGRQPSPRNRGSTTLEMSGVAGRGEPVSLPGAGLAISRVAPGHPKPPSSSRAVPVIPSCPRHPERSRRACPDLACPPSRAFPFRHPELVEGSQQLRRRTRACSARTGAMPVECARRGCQDAPTSLSMTVLEGVSWRGLAPCRLSAPDAAAGMRRLRSVVCPPLIVRLDEGRCGEGLRARIPRRRSG